jgi:hypothetical protein
VRITDSSSSDLGSGAISSLDSGISSSSSSSEGGGCCDVCECCGEFLPRVNIWPNEKDFYYNNWW